MRTLALLLLLTACSCVDVRHFAPREPRNAVSPGGKPAAVYPIEGSDAAGAIRIWSEGARGEHDADDPEVYRVEVHVGFEIQNSGETTVELADVGAETDTLRLARLEGQQVVPPGQTARIDAWFSAPDAGSTRDIASFAIRHSIAAGGRTVATHVTPFSRLLSPRNPLDHDPYYWGWGWGPYYGPDRGTGRFVQKFGPGYYE